MWHGAVNVTWMAVAPRIEKIVVGGSFQNLSGPLDELEKRFSRLRDVLGRQVFL